jgi:hypothetical protein
MFTYILVYICAYKLADIVAEKLANIFVYKVMKTGAARLATILAVMVVAKQNVVCCEFYRDFS